MSPKRYRLLLPILWLIATSGLCRAQTGSSSADSLKSYELSEIVVGAETAPVRRVANVRRVSLASIVREDAHSASDLIRLIPSAHLQTNSRGESLVYMRGGAERQISVFFDGALMNIPWDNRIDMSSIPVGMLGGVEVSQGVPSVAYGTNVIGGAINLQSRSLERDGNLTEFTGELGSESTAGFRGNYLQRRGSWTFLSSGSLFSSNGLALPSSADLASGQTGREIRTNTDRTLENVFVRLGRHTDSGNVYGLSVLHINGTRGVAPEGHLNPALDRIRYWRYPLWRNTMWIANGEATLGILGKVRATTWLGRFAQDIVQYEGPRYRTPVEREEDRDRTLGVRLISRTSPGPGDLLVSVNLLASTHDQTDIDLLSDNPRSGVLDQTYRQRTFSVGAEYVVSVRERWTFLLGTSLDGNSTPETGNKPARSAMRDYGLNSGIDYRLSETYSLRFSAGRKVRFPTMRELFSEALKRFQTNPDLVPESSWIGELAVERHSGRLSGNIITFFRRTFDTIEQENVVVEGRRKRRRINLEGSRVFGLEMISAVRLSSLIRIDGLVTWMAPVAFRGGERTHLLEKPEVLSTISIDVNTGFGATLRTSVVYTGRAWALNPEDRIVPLPTSTVFNARVSYRKYVSLNGLFTEFYAGINNVSDALSLPQLGLPGSGRTFRFGMSLSF